MFLKNEQYTTNANISHLVFLIFILANRFAHKRHCLFKIQKRQWRLYNILFDFVCALSYLIFTFPINNREIFL